MSAEDGVAAEDLCYDANGAPVVGDLCVPARWYRGTMMVRCHGRSPVLAHECEKNFAHELKNTPRCLQYSTGDDRVKATVLSPEMVLGRPDAVTVNSKPQRLRVVYPVERQRQAVKDTL